MDPEAITHALPPQDKLVPGTISLLLCGSFLAGIAFWPDFLIPAQNEVPRLSLQHMDILLETSHLPIPKPGPSGGGNQGTGGRGLLSLAAPVIQDVEPLKAQNTTPEPLTQVGDALPVVPGGNGRSAGSGPGSGGGTGGGKGWGDGRRVSPDRIEFDYNLVPTKVVSPSFTLRPGVTPVSADVIVQITVEDDGRVSSAKAVKGPEYLWSNAESNALCWAFEPLAKHGLKPPQTLRITFHYTPNSFRR